MAWITQLSKHFKTMKKIQIALPKSYQRQVAAAVEELRENRIESRIVAKDYTVWKSSPAEIANRLGWVDSPRKMIGKLPEIHRFVNDVRDDGYTHVLLLGMGGSSLAPEVFRKIFGVSSGYLDLAILDSTDPAAVLGYAERFDPATTLYIASSKSGGTVETDSFLKYFYQDIRKGMDPREAGKHFVAITDPGSPLARQASACGFRFVFLNDPDIGGRYSALSYFGLVPAALIGMDVQTLLERAVQVSQVPSQQPSEAGHMGVALGEMAKTGRDKLTFLLSPRIQSFGDWLEQLIAESTGKENKSILPVIWESLGPPAVYREDRIFVSLRLDGDALEEEKLAALEKAGHPVMRITLGDLYDLGEQCFFWEMATAVASQRLGINPFDQPDVEAAKVLARGMIHEYLKTGQMPKTSPALSARGIAVYGDVDSRSPGEALKAFLRDAGESDYIAIQAFLPQTAEVDALLLALRTSLRNRYRTAVTVGFGPRFLHSTGQLHKGDRGRGLFIQLTADDRQDVPIPDDLSAGASSVTFGMLKAAQAIGDRQALINAGRRIISFHLGMDPVSDLKYLLDSAQH